VEDIGKELGLIYAQSMPGAIAGLIAILVGIAWLGLKTDRLEESRRGPVRFGLLVLALFFAIQLPAAYSSAKDYCREEWDKAGGTSNAYDAPYPYTATKCMSIWPHGPDWG
jgi:hypothetical protein